MAETIEHKPETQQKHYEVDCRDILPLPASYGGNIRPEEEYGDLEELANSIKENGVIQPIEAFRSQDEEGKWYLIDGHRRHAACMLLAERGTIVRVKVISKDARKITQEGLIISMVTHSTGKGLSPLALSEAVRRLEAIGWTSEEIAIKFGWVWPKDNAPKTHMVRNLSLLGSAPKRIKDVVRTGKVAYTVVLDIIKDSKDYDEAVAKIEKAIGIAKDKAVKKLSDKNMLTDGIDGEELEVKVTRSTYHESENRVDSINELRRFFRNQNEKPEPVDAGRKDVYTFLERIVKNKITLQDLEQYFIVGK